MGFATGVMRIIVDITWRSIPSRFASATVVNRIIQYKHACPVSLDQNVSDRDSRLSLLLLLLLLLLLYLVLLRQATA
jgi:hypothetical protein